MEKKEVRIWIAKPINYLVNVILRNVTERSYRKIAVVGLVRSVVEMMVRSVIGFE